MDEVHYLISDASKKVDVEAHVLRYWEEELELTIPRNESGAQILYSIFISGLFKQVKNLEGKRVSVKGDQACFGADEKGRKAGRRAD